MTIDEYIRKRMNEFLQSTDTPITKLSNLIGHNSAYLTHILQGDSGISLEGLTAFCDYFQITLSDFFDPRFSGPVSDHYLLDQLSQEDKKFLLEVLKDPQKLKALENLIEAFRDEK